ncbi:hypothetical protein L6452_07971 [Arctium lappa]|uniref:Uncharacterized protein n=1 Tax=Arctium lappa TaxID=4217 RepID=A0ACB9DH24_ARCLA|nr:hypothetical protein L6452_07971 [Arctium lappa]
MFGVLLFPVGHIIGGCGCLHREILRFLAHCLKMHAMHASIVVFGNSHSCSSSQLHSIFSLSQAESGPILSSTMLNNANGNHASQVPSQKSHLRETLQTEEERA